MAGAGGGHLRLQGGDVVAHHVGGAADDDFRGDVIQMRRFGDLDEAVLAFGGIVKEEQSALGLGFFIENEGAPFVAEAADAEEGEFGGRDHGLVFREDVAREG